MERTRERPKVTLRSVLDDVGTGDYAIAVVGEEAPGPLGSLLAEAFDEPSIDVVPEADLDDDLAATVDPVAADLDPDVREPLASAGDAAVLFEDGKPVAASTIDDLYESILAINSDLFVTGARDVADVDLPDLLAGLEDARLRLRGYPLAHKEKLLLILVSRYVERLAWEGASGTVRSAFQRLSRIDDEVGTREVYERLGRTDLDVHVYGVDDGNRPDLDARVHAGEADRYRESWFVVYRPDADARPDAGGAALVCVETEPRVWDGFFTFDEGRVAAVDDRIASTF